MIANLLEKLRAAVGKPTLKLNLGCGAHFHPDWVNVDIAPPDEQIIQHNLQSPLPFKDGTFAVVYHSHVLEHLPRPMAEPFLRECQRVLARGGILRVVVPDLEVIVRLYLKYLDAATTGDPDAPKQHEWMTLELLDQMVREEPGGEMLKYWQQNPMPAQELVVERTGQEVLRYRAMLAANPPPPAAKPVPLDEAQVARFRQSGEVHKWMYDRASLRVLLGKCGFEDIKVCAAHESQIPDFNIHRLDVTPDGAPRKPDSLFMEARKA